MAITAWTTINYTLPNATPLTQAAAVVTPVGITTAPSNVGQLFPAQS